ncbi:hypothetical protein PsorP6_000873 [Peronosclerospora sorghi]|uniref:Uncharacterized protein n=1 Tax=Peronosclerospora sorghi TaxID=230839 RepID=A0ACC0WUQ7_9STRA|nr:hypothetical protein PsorP6_000873 [Peronosclerospora sorghi]
MTRVTLNVYDLSHGMARQLSPALLGKTIDGVWHTGVLVFGKEYFFGGGGIQAMAPELVAQRYGMQPVQSIPLGETRVSQQEFEEFLQQNSSRYTDATYDLLRHNCNNFSDDVSKFLVGSGIPQYIIDLPNEALNSPFGAMLRPMLENMNNQMHANQGNHLFSIPFNDPSRANVVAPAAATPPVSSQNGASVGLASRRFKISGTPNLYLDAMVKRIIALNTHQLLSEEEISALTAFSAFMASGSEKLDSAKIAGLGKIVNKLLSLGHASSFFFPALGLLRVLLLLPVNVSELGADEKACFEAVVHATEAEPSPLTSAQKTLVLAVFLNAFANPRFRDLALGGSTRFLPFVFASIADETTSHDVRVLGAQIISNCCLAMKIGEEVVVTNIVSGAIETLDRISRLEAASAQRETVEGIIVGLGRLMYNFEGARNLSIDLGLADMQLVKQVKSFGGSIKQYSHESVSTKCMMQFSIFVPPSASDSHKVPVLFYLAGLTCNDEILFIKAPEAQKIAAARGIAIVTTDTSPRNVNIPGEEDSWDFGTGAGFYVDATEPKWDEHYRMYSYVTKELPALITAHFPVLEEKQSIMGHSMGGHGALVLGIRNPVRSDAAAAC